MNQEETLTLTAIFVPDKNGGFTAFFDQFPEIITEGETKESALKNLFGLTQSVFEYKEKQNPTP